MHDGIQELLESSFRFLIEDKGFEVIDLVCEATLTSPDLVVTLRKTRGSCIALIAPAFAPDDACGLLSILSFVKELENEPTDDLPTRAEDVERLGPELERHFDRVKEVLSPGSWYEARRAELKEHTRRVTKEWMRRVSKGPDPAG